MKNTDTASFFAYGNSKKSLTSTEDCNLQKYLSILVISRIYMYMMLSSYPFNWGAISQPNLITDLQVYAPET